MLWSKVWNEEIKKGNKLFVPNGGLELNRWRALKGSHLQARSFNIRTINPGVSKDISQSVSRKTAIINCDFKGLNFDLEGDTLNCSLREHNNTISWQGRQLEEPRLPGAFEIRNSSLSSTGPPSKGLVSCAASSGPLNILSIYAPTSRTPRMASIRHLRPKQRDPTDHVHSLRLAYRFQCPSRCWWSSLSLLPAAITDRLRHCPLSPWLQPRRNWCPNTATTRTSTAELLLWPHWRGPQGLSYNPRDWSKYFMKH